MAQPPCKKLRQGTLSFGSTSTASASESNTANEASSQRESSTEDVIDPQIISEEPSEKQEPNASKFHFKVLCSNYKNAILHK